MDEVIVVTILLLCASTCAAREPVRVPMPVYDDDSCPAIYSSPREIRPNITDAIRTYLTSRYVPPICGKDGWIKVVHANLSRRNTSCPNGWTLFTSPVRGCGRNNNDHITIATFSVKKQIYTRVCGRILAIQRGVTNGFGPTFYDSKPLHSVDGITISLGTSVTQRRIWTFASMISQQPSDVKGSCPCAYREKWPNLIPQFIGSNYFCDSGNPSLANAVSGKYYVNDTLWDGKGCSHGNECCQYNDPPWFSADLGGPVSSNIDVSILINGNRESEDVLVTHIELYIWWLSFIPAKCLIEIDFGSG